MLKSFRYLSYHSRSPGCLARNLYQPANNARWSGTTSCLTPIEKIIVDNITSTGPIPVSQYMQFCLSHPEYGYYMKGDPFGVKGDFITSPEISQVFGELLAVWLASQWIGTYRRNEPKRVKRIRIVELGPGRGTLMDDILRTLLSFKQLHSELLQVHMVENSPVLRELQKEKLGPYVQSNQAEVFWWDGIDDIPTAQVEEYTMLLAHEFFDALPIRIFEKSGIGYREVLVDRVPSSLANSTLRSEGHDLARTDSKDFKPNFRFTISPTLTPVPLLTSTPRFASLPSGSRVEFSFPSYKICRRVAGLLCEGAGGAGLIVDYGDSHCFTDSFRAFRGHKIVDIFDRPGFSDLTANVDFALLKEAMSEYSSLVTTYGPQTQAQFLLSMGLSQRVDAMAKKAKEDRVEAIVTAAKMLVDTSNVVTGMGMGKRFKVLGIIGGEQEKGAVYPFNQ